MNTVKQQEISNKLQFEVSHILCKKDSSIAQVNKESKYLARLESIRHALANVHYSSDRAMVP